MGDASQAWSPEAPFASKSLRIVNVKATVKLTSRWSRSAHRHDSGKSDERFQALLFGGDTFAAQLSPVRRAKGEFTTRHQRAEQPLNNGLPIGFRHELTSLLVEQNNLETEHRDLILHLVARHHGYCRPFAPVILDDAPDLSYSKLSLTTEERQSRAAHVLERGAAERFWRQLYS